MTRGDFAWRITVPDDGHLPQRGLVPTLIQWSDARHPADRLADSGLSLVALAGEHPEPAPVRKRRGGAGAVRHPQGVLRPLAAARRDAAHAARARRDSDLRHPSAPRASIGHTPATMPSRTATMKS